MHAHFRERKRRRERKKEREGGRESPLIFFSFCFFFFHLGRNREMNEVACKRLKERKRGWLCIHALRALYNLEKVNRAEAGGRRGSWTPSIDAFNSKLPSPPFCALGLRRKKTKE